MTEVVSEELIAQEIEFVLRHMAGAERMLMPATSEDEQRRRREIIGEAAKRMFVAGLLCVKAFEPRHYKTLSTAAIQYVTDAIEKGTAAFTVQKPRGPKAFGEWMLGTSVLAVYEEIVRLLESAWAMPPTVAPRALRPGTLGSARYGEAAHVGGHRYHQQWADRARAVQQAALTVLRFSVDDPTARRWVKDGKTPGAVAIAVVGHFLKRSPRAMKDLLNKARKQLAFAKQFDSIAAARGLSAAANEPQGQPDARPPEERES